MKNKKSFNGESSKIEFPDKKRKGAFGDESINTVKNKKKKGK